MMEINNINLTMMSDNAIVEIIAAYARHHRLQQNKTQSQLAEEAGINRSTLVEFEKGKRANIITFIQILRALNLLQSLEIFEIKDVLSPIQLAELHQAKRKRASKSKSKNKKSKSDW